jgi:Plasmid encoded RepA protein
MGEVHQLITEQGKLAALAGEYDRSVIEAAAAYLANEDSEIGFVYSGWAQAALPHKRLPLAPGHRSPPSGDPIPIGVPFGSRARLILLYLQSEALRIQSREIELGRSLNAWLKRMDIPVGGKTSRDVRDQADRISRCRMTFQITQGNRTGLINQSVLDTAMFVDSDTPEQPGLFIDTAKL